MFHAGLCDEFGQIIVIQDYGGDPDTDSDSFSRYANSFFEYYYFIHSFAYVAHLVYLRDVSAGIFKKSMGARNQGGIGLSYRPARLHRPAEFIPWNQFRGPKNI
jgi:hypothetical protein